MNPGTLRARDGALIENWYIACLSRELAKRPIQRVLYEQPYVLFRDGEGQAVCLPDRCLHRAALLSRGTCESGRLICPYHGWSYDAQGQVVAIPSEGPRSQQSCIRKLALTPRPVFEQDGCIWVWMGQGAPSPPAPPWRIPHYGDPQFAQYFMITDFENEVTHLVENFMDVPHTVFVHRGWFRTRAMKPVPMTLEVADGSVLATYHQPGDSIGLTGRLVNPQGNPMTHTDRFIFPNLTRVDYQFGPGYEFVINSQCTPVATLRSRVYTCIAFRVGRVTPLLVPLMRLYTRRVIQQDVEIMQNQGESFRWSPSQEFAATAADELHLAIERLRELGVAGSAEVYSYTRRSERTFWI